MGQEGFIRFELRHREDPLEAERFAEPAARLAAWRQILVATGLVGRDPSRYGGAGFGNLSLRVGSDDDAPGRRAFLVTGTQTGGRPRLELEDLALVECYDTRRNWVTSYGLAHPSSESLTHGAIYDLDPALGAVLHAHEPVLWQRAVELDLPITDPSVPYGSPDLAREVRRLWQEGRFSVDRVLAMGGHEDGILACGASLREAGCTLLTWLAWALEAENRARPRRG